MSTQEDKKAKQLAAIKERQKAMKQLAKEKAAEKTSTSSLYFDVDEKLKKLAESNNEEQSSEKKGPSQEELKEEHELRFGPTDKNPNKQLPTDIDNTNQMKQTEEEKINAGGKKKTKKRKSSKKKTKKRKGKRKSGKKK